MSNAAKRFSKIRPGKNHLHNVGPTVKCKWERGFVMVCQKRKRATDLEWTLKT